jgi:pilus assembly protein CpaB
MRTKSLVLLILALGCGLVASIGISQVISQNRTAGGPNIETEQVVVALQEIKPGEKITAKMIGLENWDKTKIPEGTFRDMEKVMSYKLPLKISLIKGELLLESKFVSPHENVTTSIPPGYRLIPITTDASVAGGLIKPGNRVDVNWSVNSVNGQNIAVSKTILYNIKVFSVNDIWQGGQQSADNKPDGNVARSVQLVVKPEQANVITLCETAQGKFKLLLRPETEVGDEGSKDANQVDIRKVLGSGLSSSGSSNVEEAGLAKTDSLLKGAAGLLGSMFKGDPKSTSPNHQVNPKDNSEKFQTTIIEGSQQHVQQFSKAKDDPRWVPVVPQTAKPGEVPPPSSASVNFNPGLPIGGPPAGTNNSSTPPTGGNEPPILKELNKL